MFCPKCGAKLPDGSKFCGVCGGKLTDKYHAVNVVPVETKATAAAEKVEISRTKKFNWIIIAFAIVAFVVIAAVAVGAITFFGGSKKDDIFISLSEKDYVDVAFDLVTNPENGDTVELDLCYTNNFDQGMVQFSPDGKYVYYFSQYTNYGYCTLCRAEINKIKNDPENCDDYIEEIEDGVKNYFALIDNDKVLYQTDENELYLYDKDEKIKITDYAEYWILDDSNRLIYTVYDPEAGISAIYGVDLDEPEKEKVIADEVDSFESYFNNDFENIIYTTEEDGTEVLYSADFSGKKNKIFEGSNDVIFGYDEGIWILGEINGKTKIYEYKNGKLETICDSILSCKFFFNAIVYNTINSATKEEETMVFSLDNGGKIYKMSEEALEAMGDIDNYQYNEFYVLEDGAYWLCDDELMAAPIKNNSVGKFKEIADDVEYISYWNKTLYFATDTYKENYNYYGDVYCSDDGKARLLAEKIALDYIKIYDNGTIAGYREYENPYGFELFIFDSKGNEKFIDDCVEFFILVDEDTVLYISQNDLYLYKDEEKQKIKKDVYYAWSMNSLDGLDLDWFY